MTTTAPHPTSTPLQVGPFTLEGRLIVGTGKYENNDVMQEALDASGASVVTVAVRRERLVDDQGRSLLDDLDLDRYTILPNTANTTLVWTQQHKKQSPRPDLATPICSRHDLRCPFTRPSLH